MRLLSTCCYVLACLVLVAHAAASDVPELGILAVAASVIAIIAGRRRRSWATAALGFFAFVSAIAASAGDGPLLPVIALIAALHGWDMALAATRLAGFTWQEQRPIVLRYALSSALLAVAATALVALTMAVRIRLSFGLAAGLAAGFLLLAVALGILSRPRKRGGTVDAASSESIAE